MKPSRNVRRKGQIRPAREPHVAARQPLDHARIAQGANLVVALDTVHRAPQWFVGGDDAGVAAELRPALGQASMRASRLSTEMPRARAGPVRPGHRSHRCRPRRPSRSGSRSRRPVRARHWRPARDDGHAGAYPDGRALGRAASRSAPAGPSARRRWPQAPRRSADRGGASRRPRARTPTGPGAGRHPAPGARARTVRPPRQPAVAP